MVILNSKIQEIFDKGDQCISLNRYSLIGGKESKREKVAEYVFYVLKKERGMFMKLVVVEKPSVARDIAHVIGAGKKEEGYLSGNGYLIIGYFGHLFELTMPEDYNTAYEK